MEQPSKLYSEIEKLVKGNGIYSTERQRIDVTTQSLEELFISRMEGCIEAITNKYEPCFDGENTWWEQTGSTSEAQYSTKKLIQEYLNALL